MDNKIMAHTLAELLDELRINYDESLRENPFPDLPLFLFKEEEYADLITIVYLYNTEWIDEAAVPRLNKYGVPIEIGQVSYAHACTFYGSIKSEITQALAHVKSKSSLSSSSGTKDGRSLTIVSAPNSWTSVNHMMYVMHVNPLYQKLKLCIQYRRAWEFLLKWANSERVSTADQEYLSSISLSHKTPQEKQKQITQLVSVLTETQFLHYLNPRNPLALIYFWLSRISEHQKLSTRAYLLPDVLEYLYQVLVKTLLKFPVTLETLFTSQGIKIPTPTTLKPDIQLLLQQDLRAVPGLTETQWPSFLYYAALFIFEYAKTSHEMLRFTYSAKELPRKLHTLAEGNNQYLDVHVHSGPKEEYNAHYAFNLKAELVAHGITAHSRHLSLLCFENCPSLKDFFSNVWRRMGIQISTVPPIALLSSPNAFLFGHAFAKSETQKEIAINNHDCCLLQELQNIAKQRETTLQFAEKPPQTPKKEPSMMEQASSFFASLESRERTIPKDKYQLQFDIMKAEIEDPTLRETLHIGSITTAYSLCYAVNYWAIGRFISLYGVNATIPTSLSSLQTLFAVIHNVKAAELMIEQFRVNQILINSTDTSSFTKQITSFDDTLGKIDTQITLLSKTKVNEETSLRLQWLRLQNAVYLSLKMTLTNKLTPKPGVTTPSTEHPPEVLAPRM